MEVQHTTDDIRPRDVEAHESSPLLGEPRVVDLATWKTRTELWLLLQYSLPLVGTYLLQYSFTIITTFVAGHLSSDDLAATAIGLTTVNLVGFATFEGMATALDTLCSQAYGSENYHAVGLHVQRTLLLMLAAFVPMAIIWLSSPWIFPLFVKQDYLAAKAASFLHVSLIGLPAYAAFEALKRFLQTQGDCNAALVVLLICTPINACLSWLFAFHLGLGLQGAALGAAVTNNVRALMLLLYIVFFARESHKCWGGFSREALRNWGPMMKLSLAGSALNLGEWLAFEVVAFSTSYISVEHLAAMTILTQLGVIMWHIPFSVSVAVSIRIGHLIGAGAVGAAKRAAFLYGACFMAIGIFDGILFLAFSHQLSSILTNDESVRRLSAEAMIVVAAFQLADAANAGSTGLLRGLGRQSFAGWVVLPVNYLFSVPLAIWLELGWPAWKIKGAWTGLALGLATTAIVNFSYMKVMNWDDCAEDAKERVDAIDV